MADNYGSDFITISDEDGQEFELEVLTELEYNGFTYLAVIPAGLEEEEAQEFGVASIPTLVVMQDGRIIEQASGAKPKPLILSMLEG